MLKIEKPNLVLGGSCPFCGETNLYRNLNKEDYTINGLECLNCMYAEQMENGHLFITRHSELLANKIILLRDAYNQETIYSGRRRKDYKINKQEKVVALTNPEYMLEFLSFLYKITRNEETLLFDWIKNNKNDYREYATDITTRIFL